MLWVNTRNPESFADRLRIGERTPDSWSGPVAVAQHEPVAVGIGDGDTPAVPVGVPLVTRAAGALCSRECAR